jgi:hypothetical protein
MTGHMRVHYKAVALLVALGLAGCDDGYLRGSVTPSEDGLTYLAVVDDNGGHCGPLLVDGTPWEHGIGEAGLISPGRHSIKCGAPIEFEIPEGVVFRFDYWGP